MFLLLRKLIEVFLKCKYLDHAKSLLAKHEFCC